MLITVLIWQENQLWRQNALITILAQMEVLFLQIIYRISRSDFSRAGASDDLRGRSTFMVEMSETALILNNATDKLLVI